MIDTLRVKVGSIVFVDDTFTLNRKRVFEICDLIKEKGINLTLRCESRVNLVDEELLAKMYDVGFNHISFGVESGNQEIINEWNKRITLDQARTAFKTAHKIGYTTTAYMIIGAPSETPSTVRDSINFAKELDPDFIQWSLASPLPSTPLHTWFIEHFGEVEDWGGINYMSVFQKDKPKISVYRSKYMTNEELNIWVKRAYRETYLSPHYILKRLRRMTNLQELRGNLNGLRDILGVQR